MKKLIIPLLLIGCTVLPIFKYSYRFTTKVFIVTHEKRGFGTGFFVDKDILLTAGHVVKGVKEVEIYRRDWWLTRKAVVAYNDPEYDVSSLCYLGNTDDISYGSLTQTIPMGEKLYVTGNSIRTDFDTFTCTLTHLFIKPEKLLCKKEVDGNVLGFSGAPALDGKGGIVGMLFAQLSDEDLDKNVIGVIIPSVRLERAVNAAKEICRKKQ